MTADQRRRGKKEAAVPPGDDEVPAPPPVKEEPPHNRYCDLVLTGGVASGVVYPWAIVEIARAYRFRNIGGTSVGAMAAALAAAAEYGRRTGCESPFEVLRRAPASLGEVLPDGRTRMLSLFQPNPHGERLIWLWGKLGRGRQFREAPNDHHPRWGGPVSVLLKSVALTRRLAPGAFARIRMARIRLAKSRGCLRAVGLILRAFALPLALGAATGAVLAKGFAVGLGQPLADWSYLSIASMILVSLIFAVVFGVFALWSDIRYGLIENSYGLCKGGTIKRAGSNKNGPSGMSEWLHDNIQRSAGLKSDEPPLSFRDLWSAPAYPGAERRAVGPDDPLDRRSINLQMITTNVTHGRPYRLPLTDSTSRLFFKLDELEDYFPKCVLDALQTCSRPYAPLTNSDPPAELVGAGWLELPGADLPVVVAARLSLSFPLLFSAVPLWAIDYEEPKVKQRTLRRCLFTDGGVSSNFPLHLFDAAMPRWPTFGLWLDRRPPYNYWESGQPGFKQDVWLPQFNGQGRGDNWNRFDPESKPGSSRRAAPVPLRKPRVWGAHFRMFIGFLSGIAASSTDWLDRTSFRLPHTRNRVARMMLYPGEGGLNIGMSRKQILDMAHRYGTKAGQKFVEQFSETSGRPARAWSEQRWIRFNLLINGLREQLDGLATGAGWSTDAMPLRHAIKRAVKNATRDPEPVADHGNRYKIEQSTADLLLDLVCELERLEGVLQATPTAFSSPPEPELRLRPPL